MGIFKIRCVHCGQKLEGEEEWELTLAQCPVCGHIINLSRPESPVVPEEASPAEEEQLSGAEMTESAVVPAEKLPANAGKKIIHITRTSSSSKQKPFAELKEEISGLSVADLPAKTHSPHFSYSKISPGNLFLLLLSVVVTLSFLAAIPFVFEQQTDEIMQSLAEKWPNFFDKVTGREQKRRLAAQKQEEARKQEAKAQLESQRGTMNDITSLMQLGTLLLILQNQKNQQHQNRPQPKCSHCYGSGFSNYRSCNSCGGTGYSSAADAIRI